MTDRIKSAERGVSASEILNKIVPFLGLAIMIAVFQYFGEGKLLTQANIKSILNQSVYVAIMAFGAIFVYSHGGMDLSYGSVIGFSVLCGILIGRAGAPLPVVIITNIFSAVIWFVFNGVVSVYLKVSPFITSLCIMCISRLNSTAVRDGRRAIPLLTA